MQLFWIGAGMGADSSVPPPPAETDIDFLWKPEAVRRAYHDWLERLRGVQLHPGYRELAELQRQRPSVRVVTLNQDGLLQRAGCQALELHGGGWRWRCRRCRLPVAGQEACPACRGDLRPAVVWPGEDLESEVVDQLLEWLQGCELLVAVGTSGTAEPAADLIRQAYRRGARLIELNPRPTALSDICHESRRGRAAELLPALIREF